MAPSRIDTLRQTLLASLLVMPVFLMSLVPQGTMAMGGAQGIEVVLCTGDGPLTILVDENGTPIDEQVTDAAGCGWWGLAQGLALTASPDTHAPVSRFVLRLSANDDWLVPAAAAAPVPPARAPPLV